MNAANTRTPTRQAAQWASTPAAPSAETGATTKSAKKQIKQMHTHSSIAFQLGMELENKTLAFVIFEMPN